MMAICHLAGLSMKERQALSPALAELVLSTAEHWFTAYYASRNAALQSIAASLIKAESEFSSRWCYVALSEDGAFQGGYFALPGPELRRARLADSVTRTRELAGPVRAQFRSFLTDVGGFADELPAGAEHLAAIGVAPSSRGCGVAGTLLEHWFDQARRRDTSRLSLNVEPMNDIAKRLYRRFGFELVRAASCENRQLATEIWSCHLVHDGFPVDE